MSLLYIDKLQKANADDLAFYLCRSGRAVTGACVYCRVRPAGNNDHVIPKSVLGRAIRDATLGVRAKDPLQNAPDWLRDTERACFQCNTAKGTRLLVPPHWASRLRRLNALGIGTFRVWDGSPEMLRTVVK